MIDSLRMMLLMKRWLKGLNYTFLQEKSIICGVYVQN